MLHHFLEGKFMSCVLPMAFLIWSHWIRLYIYVVCVSEIIYQRFDCLFQPGLRGLVDYPDEDSEEEEEEEDDEDVIAPSPKRPRIGT